MPRTRVAGSMLLLLAAACAPGGSAAAGPELEATATTVTIINDSDSDVVMYAVRSEIRYRLGSVARMDTRTFALPALALTAGAGTRLLADPVGTTAPPYLTELIPAQEGDQIELHLKRQIANSSVAIRRQ